MPWDALPPHIDEPREWKGTDWDWWGQRWLLKLKGLFAYGPRSAHRWARWREYPKILFAFKGPGRWRWETTDNHPPKDGDRLYLSPIQYYAKWSLVLMWPLHLSGHWYFKKPPYPDEEIIDDHKMIYFRIGARRDSDIVYWFPSMFLGRTFN